MSYVYNAIPPAIDFHNAYNSGLYTFFLLVCGARSGKTRATLGGQLAADAFWQPGYYKRDIDIGEPYRILVCEPTVKMVRLIAWALVKKALKPMITGKPNETFLTITTKGVHGETHIVFATYEQGAEKIEGTPFYRAYCDECFQMSRKFYHEVVVRTSDRKGKIIMVGTPKPVAWIQDEIIDKSGLENRIFFKTWKTKDNPYFPAETLNSLRKILPEKIYMRNYEASLDGFDGQIFEIEKDIHFQDFEFKMDDYKMVWGGVDWGWTHNGVAYVVGLRDDDFVDVMLEHSAPHMPVVSLDNSPSWAEVLLAFQNRFEDKFDMFYAGVDQPESIDTLRGLGVRITGADNAVLAGIQFLSTLLKVYIDQNGKKTSKIRIHKKNCPELCKKLPMMRWDEGKEGVFHEKPVKKDDDEADALRYALFSNRNWFKLYTLINKDWINND